MFKHTKNSGKCLLMFNKSIKFLTIAYSKTKT